MRGNILSRMDLLPRGGRILCALSGGADSVAMTHALCTVASELGLTVAAAHFSHGLRPEAAGGERALCQTLCDALGIPLFCGGGDTLAFALAEKCTKEEAARHLRYAFLQQTAAEWQADCIATGHHRGDQAETVLFHLARGSGLAGLRGMPASRGNIIRPMLDTGREEILHYVSAHELPYVIDESNADACYSRNRIRHQVLPQLELVHPGAEANIVACAHRLATDEDCLSQLAARALEEEDAPGIPCSAFLAQHPAVQIRVLQQMYAAASGGEALCQTHLDAVTDLCKRNIRGRIALPCDLWAVVAEQRLTVGALTQPAEAVPPAYLQPEETLLWGEWELCFTAEPEAKGFVFDRQSIVFPVLVRPRQEGDRIPLSATSHKSVKKLLNECKIPVDMRDSIPILCDNKGVLAVADLRMDPTRSGDSQKDKITMICRRIKKWHTT